MAESGLNDFRELSKFIVSNKDPSLPQKIINAVTTNETFWFRDLTPWKYLEESLLPHLVKMLLNKNKSKIRIWSTAVSSGQEIYSTVMCIDNYLRKNNIKGISLSNFEFLATDISSRVLETAKKGRYDRTSIMRGLTPYYRKNFFTEEDSEWIIDTKIREAVRFMLFNLQKNFSMFGTFDIIFCRYVLIYFSDELKRSIVSRMKDALNSGGVLFTGNYTLYDLFNDGYNINHYGKLTYFSKKENEA